MYTTTLWTKNSYNTRYRVGALTTPGKPGAVLDSTMAAIKAGYPPVEFTHNKGAQDICRANMAQYYWGTPKECS